MTEPKQFSVLLYDWQHTDPQVRAKLERERERIVKRLSAKLKRKDHGEYRFVRCEKGAVTLSREREHNVVVQTCTESEARQRRLLGRAYSIPRKAFKATATTATRVVFEQRSKR